MDETPQQMFMRTLHIDSLLAEALEQAGFTMIDEVAYVPLAELLEVENVPEARLIELRQLAREHIFKEAFDGDAPPWEGMTDV